MMPYASRSSLLHCRRQTLFRNRTLDTSAVCARPCNATQRSFESDQPPRRWHVATLLGARVYPLSSSDPSAGRLRCHSRRLRCHSRRLRCHSTRLRSLCAAQRASEALYGSPRSTLLPCRHRIWRVRNPGESATLESPQPWRVRNPGESAAPESPQPWRVRSSGESATLESPQPWRVRNSGESACLRLRDRRRQPAVPIVLGSRAPVCVCHSLESCHLLRYGATCRFRKRSI